MLSQPIFMSVSTIMFTFLSRQGQFLNVRGEKTPESLFYQMLTSTVAQWPKLKLVDYCCAESIMVEDTGNKSTGTLFFVFFYFILNVKNFIFDFCLASFFLSFTGCVIIMPSFVKGKNW